MAVHTPGPWGLENLVRLPPEAKGVRIVSAAGWEIGTFIPAEAGEEYAPNARLIAASPDLLADSADSANDFKAIRQAAEIDTDDGEEALRVLSFIRKEAAASEAKRRAAIAKATGGQ